MVDLNKHLARSAELRQEFERLYRRPINAQDDLAMQAALRYVQETDALVAQLLRMTQARSPAEPVA